MKRVQFEGFVVNGDVFFNFRFKADFEPKNVKLEDIVKSYKTAIVKRYGKKAESFELCRVAIAERQIDDWVQEGKFTWEDYLDEKLPAKYEWVRWVATSNELKKFF